MSKASETRKRSKKARKERRGVRCRCSSCGRRSLRLRAELHRAARVHCEVCGGPVNRIRDERPA